LVGENGAGKSTLVKLLLRFYDADQGAVRVGGLYLRDLEPEELRGRIGVLFQDYASYELSVRENVVMGRPGGTPDDERVRQARRGARGGQPRHAARGCGSRCATRAATGCCRGCPTASTRRSDGCSREATICRAASGSGWVRGARGAAAPRA